MESSLSILKRRSLVLMAIILLGVFVTFIGAGTPSAHAATDPVVCPSPGSLQGVDVSEINDTIDWTRVAQAGKSFGYAEATVGTRAVDPSFQTNFVGMKRAGMKAGGILTFEVGDDPMAQANIFLSSLSQAGFTAGDLIPAIDTSEPSTVPPGLYVSRLQTVASTIQTTLGVKPVIFTSAGIWASSAGGSTAFSTNPLWVGQFSVSCPNIPFAWSTWALWQYSDFGFVSGIPGSADLDRSNGPTLPIYTVAEQINGLINRVNSFQLSNGLQTSLNAKLMAALSEVNAGNIADACGSLTAFINQVNAQSGKGLTTDQAAQLLAAAQLIQAALDC